MKHRLQRTQQLHCDAATAWQFFSSPNNLSEITPKELNFVVLTKFKDEDIYEGMIIEYKVRPLLGIPLHWRTVIRQVTPGVSFTDHQQKGPYKYWNHHHEFIPNESGTLMIDTVDYELPFGIIGDIFHPLVVKRKLEHIFDYRYEVLEKLFNRKKQVI